MSSTSDYTCKQTGSVFSSLLNRNNPKEGGENSINCVETRVVCDRASLPEEQKEINVNLIMTNRAHLKLKKVTEIGKKKSKDSFDALSAGFLEDFVEIWENDWKGSMLESTVDGSVVPTLTKSQVTSAGEICKQYRAEEECSNGKVWYQCYHCRFIGRSRSVVEQHLNTGCAGQGRAQRTCPYCHLQMDQPAFFKHMRAMHMNALPFRCGYCSFLACDVNQVKHHQRKKHPGTHFRCVNLLRLGQGTAGKMGPVTASSQYEYNAGSEEEEMADPSRPQRTVSCPVCGRIVQTLTSLKVHMKLHKRARFRCRYCGYLAVNTLQVERHSRAKHKLMKPSVEPCELDPCCSKVVASDIEHHLKQVYMRCSRQPRDPDPHKWRRRFSCPHCPYTCNFGASYRRHLRLHGNSFPYRCSYCTYKSREKYYVRRHIRRIHEGLAVVVIDNTSEGPCSMEGEPQPIGKLRQKRGRRHQSAAVQ